MKAFGQPDGYENSIEAKVLDLSDKAGQVAWMLAKACTDKKNRTKDQMIETMVKAQEIALEIRAALTGG